MNSKVFDVGFTQAKHFIDVHNDLAEFFAIYDKKVHWPSQSIAGLTPIMYNHPAEPTWLIDDGTTTTNNVQLKIYFSQWESDNNKVENDVSTEKVIMQQAYFTFLG